MSGDYAPGRSRFDTYLSFALPLTVLVVIFAYSTRLGYDREGTWSLATWAQSVRDWFKFRWVSERVRGRAMTDKTDFEKLL